MKRSDTSRASQRAAILNYLQSNGSITTIYAREMLGIMSPAARVLELREQGHRVVTHWTKTTDNAGTKHREAKYVLFDNAIKKAPPPTTKLTERALLYEPDR
jgi:hypothetical protein